MRTFGHVLINTLVANMTTAMVWFGFTFWAYLETRSVLVTAILGGAYLLLIAVMSVPFGTLIDRVRKKTAMVIATMVTGAAFTLGTIIYYLVPTDTLLDLRRPFFWVFLLVLLTGAVVESIRGLALATCVTLLVPAEGRARANGLVGMTQGIGFALNSVLSGLAVGYLGMGPLLIVAVLLIGLSAAHLRTIKIDEPVVVDAEGVPAKVDIVAAFKMTSAVPGLLALIFFSTFNNLLGGVYTGLLDPYGLELVRVEIWGTIYGVVSVGFVIGGAIIARTGLGANPVRTLLLVNLVMWALGGLMVIRESLPALIIGMVIYMAMISYAEASEQTVLQKVVPYAQQGRVFGFAQAVEIGAAPISSFAVGPIAEFWLIPYMNSDRGQADWGWLLGAGSTRGIALVFILASVLGLILTIVALGSRPYKTLSKSYADAVVNDEIAVSDPEPNQ